MARRQKASPGPPADQRQSRLLSLPPELRNRIYHYHFPKHRTVSIERPVTRSGRPSQPNGVLAILLTCRQVNDEAAGLFYHLNRFRVSVRHVHPRSNAPTFFSVTSAPRLEAVREMTIAGLSIDQITGRSRQMRDLAKLRILRLEVNFWHGMTKEEERFEEGWLILKKWLRTLPPLEAFSLQCSRGSMAGKVAEWEGEMKAEITLT